MKCPNCRGAKTKRVLFAHQITGTGEIPIYQDATCQTCWGKGWVTEKQNSQFQKQHTRR